MKTSRFHPEADEEYEKAIAHYAGIDPDLGRKFETRVETAVAKLTARPNSYVQDEDNGCQYCVVKKFPYSVHYLELETYVWIVAIAHHSRKPGYWLHRLRDR